MKPHIMHTFMTDELQWAGLEFEKNGSRDLRHFRMMTYMKKIDRLLEVGERKRKETQ